MYAGRIELIKSVSTRILKYTGYNPLIFPISVFKDSKGSLQTSFWRKKTHAWSWEKSCKPKIEEELGSGEYLTFAVQLD